ncbi:class I SAM-dependent methyltransferase [Parasphingopyxis sp.]|uniref:class I SAM-dependent methyltransferase n=1 Tax=Parasphingopyxis sp. TaxID=1920299 RepID=UPI00263008D2|nr:class I SAM-dependent methyltransferase [Parasphingopyxis sp.]
MKATAIVRKGRVPVPDRFARQCEWEAGDKVHLSTDAPGRLIVSRTKPSDNLLRSYPAPQNGTVLTGGAVLRKAGLEIGDVVAIELRRDGKVSLERVDPRSEQGFVSPERDEHDMPIPPGWLCQAFTSMPDPRRYLRSGERSAKLILELAEKHGQELSPESRILDFGCGSGRVARFLPRLTPGQVLACDLHPDAIEWCQRHMGFGEFFQGQLTPPMHIEDDSIDLMYAVSVLTHLDMDHQLAWLSEWARILKKGALAIVTFSGDDFVEKVLAHAPGYQDAIRETWAANDGFAFIDDDGWRGVFPDAYQNAYQTWDSVRKIWGEFFTVEDILASGEFSNRQNCAILRKP